MMAPRAWTAGLMVAALVLLSSCGSQPTLSPTPTPRIASTVPAPTKTLKPTLTPTGSLTLSPTLSPTPRPTNTATPTSTPVPPPIRAVRLDFGDFTAHATQVVTLEQKLMNANVNLVALGAGRLDWTYFKWAGHKTMWSGDIQNSGTDFLAVDAARFSQWAKVDAVVDVFAPRYIAAHPQAAAVSWLGKVSDHLVSTSELVNGDFGNQLIEMLDYLAANYPVNSISITELAYYIDGYGEDDRAAYRAYTGRTDWPRTLAGLINIDDPSIGEWRSYELGRFLQRAAEVVHRHGKQLYMDVEVSWGNLALEALNKGQKYDVLLGVVDRLVVWNYFSLSGYRPDYTARIVQALEKYGPDRIIISIGLWAKGNRFTTPEALRQAMQSALGSAIPNLWITPSLYLSDAHWQVLTDLWGAQK